MPKFTFTITRDISESAQITVEADTIEEAHMKGTQYDIYESATFTVDDGNIPRRPYISDPDSYEVE